MGDVNFLNLEYFLLRVYHLYTGAGVGSFDLAAQLFTLWQGITFIGLFISLVLVVLTVWARVRAVIVEHEGFHQLEVAAAHAAAAREESKGNARWERVIDLMKSPEESNWRLAIIEADSLLEELLNNQGYIGDTVGEKLKSANPQQFSTLDVAWRAHKVRNAVAHLGAAYPLTEREARATIDYYARVFEEFGII
jgi:hypothetical protein